MDSETEVRVHGNVVSNGDGGCPESIQQRHSVLVRRETTRAAEAKKRTLAFVQAGSLTSRQFETTTYNVCILRVYIVYCRQIAGRRIRWELTIWQFLWDKEQLYMQDWLWKAQNAPTIAPRVNTWRFGGYLWCTASRSGLAVSESDCGVRGPRFESPPRAIVFIATVMWCAALGTGCTPLLRCLSQLSLASVRGR